MSELIVEVRRRLAAKEKVALLASAYAAGKKIIQLKEPQMFVLVKIEEPYFVGHFFSKEDLLFFPQNKCQMPTREQVSAVVDAPCGVLPG